MNPSKTTPAAPSVPPGRAGADTPDRRLNPDAPPVYDPTPLGTNSVQGNNYSGQPVEAPVPDEVKRENGDTPVDKTKAKK